LAATDPKTIIRGIISAYITGTPLTKDDGVTNASDLHIFERGEENWKRLFFTEGFDIVFFYGEPRVGSIRPIQDVPVHFLMDYPVTVVTVNKHDPVLGGIVCTATTMQAKARTALRAAIAASAQTGAAVTPAYTIRVTNEVSRNEWQAGLNIFHTTYTILYTTGGP